jgi:hypothetical protein
MTTALEQHFSAGVALGPESHKNLLGVQRVTIKEVHLHKSSVHYFTLTLVPVYTVFIPSSHIWILKLTGINFDLFYF